MRVPPKILAEFYYQFGTLIDSGVSIQQALATLQQSAPRPLRPCMAGIAAAVGRGESFHQALADYAGQFATLDRQTIAVSEQTGTLDIGLMALSKYYEARAQARQKILSASAFPALLLVAAVFISHFPQLILGAVGNTDYSILNYAVDTVGFLVLLVGGGLFVAWLVRRLLQTPGLKVTADRVLRAVPVIGRLRFELALSQWLASVRVMLNAGIVVFSALDYATEATTSPLIADAYARARPLIHDQMDISAALRSTGVFPDEVIQYWATGEQSGRLDEMLERLARQSEERWRHSLDQLAAWLPRIVYGLVSLFIVVQIGRLLMPVASMYQDLLK